jgi:hypothetical protein
MRQNDSRAAEESYKAFSVSPFVFCFYYVMFMVCGGAAKHVEEGRDANHLRQRALVYLSGGFWGM